MALAGMSAGLVAGAPVAASGSTGARPMSGDRRRPLKADTISVAAIQTRVQPTEPGLARKAIAENLASVVEAIDRVQSDTGHKDLVTFSALALQGWVGGDAADLRAAAIDIDGPEVAAIASRARAYSSHVSFGAWVTDPDWPGQVIAMSILVGPDGTVMARDWTPYLPQSSLPDAGRHAATVEREFDRFVEMYGADAVLPVHATTIGNLAQSPLNGAPEVYRAYALKGAEVFVRTAPLGFQTWDVQAAAAHNHCFAIVTMAAAPSSGDIAASHPWPRAGGTTVYGPHGEVMAEAGSKWEQAVVATLPLGAYRAVHQRPELASRLFMPVYDALANETSLV